MQIAQHKAQQVDQVLLGPKDHAMVSKFKRKDTLTIIVAMAIEMFNIGAIIFPKTNV